MQHSLWSKVKSYNCHKNKIRTNEPKIWQNNKNTEPQPKLSGSYKKKKVYARKSFAFTGAKVYNMLPLEAREMQAADFALFLKKHFS